MKVHRNEIVARLRDTGRDAEADRAMAELPERFDVTQYEQKLHSYGLPIPYEVDDPLSRGAVRYRPIGGDGGM